MFAERGGCGAQGNAILRTLRACDAGFDRTQVEFQRVGEERLGLAVMTPQALFFCVCLDQGNLVCIAARELQIANRFAIDREYGAGGTELRRHVGKRCPVGQRQLRQPVAVEFDKLADDAFLAQHFGYGQHEVGCRGAFADLACQLEANDLWNQHGDWLIEHRGFGFDTANAPAEHTQRVDHRRM